MSDTWKILIPSLVAVVPALLLFLQNRSSSERETEDRQRERQAEDKRRDQDLEARKLDLEAARDAETVKAQEAAQQRERDRYVRFLTAAQDVGMHWKVQEGGGTFKRVPAELRAEVASSYEDALLSAPDQVQASLESVKGVLDKFGSAAIAPTYDELQSDLMDLRQDIRYQLKLA